jgi:membrane protein involved in colicin uptake
LKAVDEISKLNLKDEAETMKVKLEQSWTKSEVSSLLNKAKSLSEENTKKDEEEKQRIEQEKKAAEEANKKRTQEEEEKREKAKRAAQSNNVSQEYNSSSVPSGSTSGSGTKSFGPNQAREAFEQITADLGVTGSEKQIWADIITKESGWNVYATNPSSGAYGLPQSLPGNKMASVGGDYLTNPYTQLMWMYKYVHERYGSFAGVNWYSRGWY